MQTIVAILWLVYAVHIYVGMLEHIEWKAYL